MPNVNILEKKKEAVNQLAEKFEKALTIVLADFRGITVEEDTELRAALRKADIEYRIIKNNISSRAMKKVGIQGADEYLVGPTALAISYTDVSAPAKILSEYQTKIQAFEVKAGIVDKVTVGADGVKDIAEIPPKQVLQAMALGALNAPINGLVNVLSGSLRNFATVIDAIAEKKEKEAV